jgi:hypothetical protein
MTALCSQARFPHLRDSHLVRCSLQFEALQLSRNIGTFAPEIVSEADERFLN